jgi:hypothetical protein
VLILNDITNSKASKEKSRHGGRKLTKKRKRVHKNLFENIGNHIIDQNFQGKLAKFESDMSHVQPERKELADLEFKNRDVDTVDVD